MTIALIGNPNSGKTTLFNALTGSNLYVGNWAGVTVERKEARFTLNGEMATLIDLPGVYSLTPYSLEEQITADYIASGAADVILNIVDATNLERNLYLTMQLIERGARVAVALNMTDELNKLGVSLDADALSAALGVEIASISARDKKGFDDMFAAVSRASHMPARRMIPPKSLSDTEFLLDAEARYKAIEGVLQGIGFAPPKRRRTGERLDKVLSGGWTAYPAFLIVLGTLFLLAFGSLGTALTELMRLAVNLLGALLNDALSIFTAPAWMISLLLNGALAGAGAVLSFLPQILIIFAFLSVLEDSGYMARAAFITDRWLRNIGLSGRSFIPMLMGFGCTTTAVIAARGVENERDRRLTALLTPFMSCGAKLPIYALFAGAFFGGNAPLVILGLYVLGMLFMALAGIILKKLSFGGGESPFMMELPPYRMPAAKTVFRSIRQRAKDFIIRAGGIIVVMSMATWFLQYFGMDMRVAANAQSSIFAALGRSIAPIFAPLGFGEWEKCVALLTGLAAKEAVISTMQVLYSSSELIGALHAHFTAASACSFLTFTLLYAPCVSALSVMRREIGGKYAALSAVMQTGIAYVAAFIVYSIARAI